MACGYTSQGGVTESLEVLTCAGEPIEVELTLSRLPVTTSSRLLLVTARDVTDIDRARRLSDAILDNGDGSPEVAVEGKVISQPIPVTVGGRAGQQYQIRGTVNNLPIVYWLVVAESEQHYHQVLLWTLGTMESQHAPTVQRIITETVVRSSF